MNGVTSMASNYYKSWTIGQSNSNNSFAAISGSGSSSMSGMMNIANQYNSINSNRASMESYYRKMVKDDNFKVNDFLNSGSSSSTDSSKVSADIIDDTKALKDSAEKLSATGDSSLFAQKADGTYDMEKITAAVNDFAKNYNEVASSVAGSGNMSILQKGANMLNQSATNYNSLKKVGINVGINGKLSVDTEKLKNADVNDLKSLFEGNNSYASKVANTAQNINQAAQSNQYKTYSNSGAASFSFANTLGNFVNYSA